MKVRKFSVENCDIRTQLMWEDWATIPAYKILTLLLARKGKSIFSSQGISEILGLPKSTVIHALKLLRLNEYILRDGGSYYLNVGRVFDQPVGQSTNPLVEPTNPLVETDQPIGQNLTNPLVTNNDKEIIIKNNEKENKDSPPAKVSKFLDIARQSLVSVSDPKIQKDAQFISLGRRPMVNYPDIKLTELELCEILEDYEAAGIPIDNRKLFMSAFKNVQSKIKTKTARGQTTAFTNAFSWLIGFEKETLLKNLKASLDLKRSEIYAEKASA